VPEASIGDAIAAVDVDPTTAHDTILIGPGTYLENPNLQDSGNHQVDIVGAGEGQTTIETSPGKNETTLSVDDPASTVRDLSINVPDGNTVGNTNYGLSLVGSGTRVAVIGDSGTVASNAILLGPVATLSSSTVLMPNSETGVLDEGGTVSDTKITAGTGVQGVGTISRTRIFATTGVYTPSSGTLTIDDSLIITVPGPAPETAISLTASDTLFLESMSAKLRHDTLIGDGSSASIGIFCHAQTSKSDSVSCSTTVDSSIIRGFQHSISRGAAGVGTAAANVSLDYSDLDPSGDLDSNQLGGTGSIALGGHDLNVDPAFASTMVPLAYQLSAGSPVIDKGDPVLGSGEPTTDLAGNPRVVAGRNGAPAVSDVGAFEFQPKLPTVSAAAGASGARVGAPIGFTASASDPAPGDSVSVSWQFDDGSSATGASVTHAFSTPGTHTATATATDLDGYSARASVSVTVGGPMLSHPKLRPSRFKAKSGTLVSYTDSQAATATLVVLHPVAGVRKGRSCAARSRTHEGKHPKTCIRWVALKGSFEHQDAAGANSFRFSDHKLGPGSYRLQIVATSALGASAPVEASFKIKWP
jgi:hypothetical protein